MLVVVLVSADRGMLVGWLGTRNAHGGGSRGPGSWSRLVVQVQVQVQRDGEPKAEGRRRAWEKDGVVIQVPGEGATQVSRRGLRRRRRLSSPEHLGATW